MSESAPPGKRVSRVMRGACRSGSLAHAFTGAGRRSAKGMASSLGESPALGRGEERGDVKEASRADGMEQREGQGAG